MHSSPTRSLQALPFEFIARVVSEVAATLLDLHLHRLLVIDEDELVGIISTSDLIGLLVEAS